MPGRREENAGKRMLKHLSAILEKSGVIIFEYHIKTDTLIRYNKELEVEVEIPKYCDYLRDKTRIYPDDRWKAIEFYSGRIKGPIDIREVDDDGYVSSAWRLYPLKKMKKKVDLVSSLAWSLM